MSSCPSKQKEEEVELRKTWILLACLGTACIPTNPAAVQTPASGGTPTGSTGSATPATSADTVTVSLNGTTFAPTTKDLDIYIESGDAIRIMSKSLLADQQSDVYSHFSLLITLKSAVKEGFTKTDVNMMQFSASHEKAETPGPDERWEALIAIIKDQVTLTKTSSRLIGTVKIPVRHANPGAETTDETATITFDVAFPKTK